MRENEKETNPHFPSNPLPEIPVLPAGFNGRPLVGSNTKLPPNSKALLVRVFSTSS